jgi:hypothetical protein
MSMSTPRKTLRRLLWDALSGRISLHGFRGNRARREFVRRYDFGKVFFCINFVKHPNDFDITADILIRYDAVEEIVQRMNKKLTEKQKQNTITLGGDLGNLSTGRQMRWTVSDEADVEPAAAQIEEQFVKIALPYVERYGNMENAYNVLSSDKRADWCHRAHVQTRAMSALLMALVLKKDEQEVSRLIQQKRAYLGQNVQFGLPQFDEFVKSIAEETGTQLESAED